jgi:hypothetical protein
MMLAVMKFVKKTLMLIVKFTQQQCLLISNNWRATLGGI